MPGPRIKIAISVYKDSDHLALLLQSIDWYTLLPRDQYSLVVCDDGSPNYYRCSSCSEEIPTSGSKPNNCPKCGRTEFSYHSWSEEIKAVCARFGAIYIQNVDADGNPKNQGIPSTWNHLALSLGGEAEIVILLNNDILVVPNWEQVAIHFLDANKDNPHVGSMFWNPYNRFNKEMMRAALPNLGTTLYSSLDQVTGSDDWFALAHEENPKVVEDRQGDGQGLGRVMCACGCCFAFRMDVFREIEALRKNEYSTRYGVDPNTITGMFDPRFTSFFEESHAFTLAASIGRASFGFPYPRPYHVHSACFGANPELECSKRMTESRKLYREYWNVPNSDPSDFDAVHARLMEKIPQVELKYLSPDYEAEPTEYTLRGGEKMVVPRLVEKTGVF